MTATAPWYAIWTRSRHEAVVRQQLDRKQIETFLPMVTRWSHWRDRKKRVDWPLFPGYCFARFDVDDSLRVLRCAGVARIISVGGRPVAVPQRQLDAVRLLITSELQYDPCPFIAEGAMVEITHGPLRGVIGRLLRKDSQKTRLMLSVDMINQAVSVEVDASDVKAC